MIICYTLLFSISICCLIECIIIDLQQLLRVSVFCLIQWEENISPCQCNIVVCTLSKKVVCTVHTTILHWQENLICTYNIFHLQFHNCYLLFECKYLLKQCTILCQLRLSKLSKSAIFNFWGNYRFLKKVVCTTYDYIAQTQNLNFTTNGAYDYLALTWQFMKCAQPSPSMSNVKLWRCDKWWVKWDFMILINNKCKHKHKLFDQPWNFFEAPS